MKLRHWLMVGLALVAWGLLLADRASADVRVSLSPDDAVTAVRSATGYTVTATSDAPAVLDDVFLMLPGHGQPCGQADEPGEPYGGDPDTNFQVTTPGVLVASRIVTWPGPFLVDAGAPLQLHLDVLTPDIAACFYAGASAHTSAPVVGVAQGAELDVVQHADFGTGGYFSWEPRHWTLYWYAYTQAAGCVEQWRLGLPAGFTLIDSSLGAGKQRNVASFSRQWKTERCLAAGESAYEWVTVSTTLCSSQGATVHARLRVWRDDGVIAGTGDGPGLDLPPC